MRSDPDIHSPWLVEWLEDFENFYRGIGLLGSGFRVTQQDRARVAGGVDDRPLLQTQWLRMMAGVRYEMPFLAQIDGSNVLAYEGKSIFYPNLVAELSTISRGCFTPTDLSWEVHDVDFRSFQEVRCTWGGVERCLFLPYFKWMDSTVFYELNRWIAHTGRRFAILGYNDYGETLIACIDDVEAEALESRGITPEFTGDWKLHPRELLPLVHHFVAAGAYEKGLDVTGFNPDLADRAPELHLERAKCFVGLGREAEAWRFVGAAHKHGLSDAAERLRAWSSVCAVKPGLK